MCKYFLCRMVFLCVSLTSSFAFCIEEINFSEIKPIIEKDYVKQLKSIQKIAFCFEEENGIVESKKDITKTGTIEFEDGIVHLLLSDQTPDKKESYRYELFLHENKKYITILNEIQQKNFVVSSVLDTTSLKDDGIAENQLGPYGIIFGIVKLSENKHTQLAEIIKDNKFEFENLETCEGVRMRTYLRDEQGNLVLEFVKNNNGYVLKKIEFQRDKSACIPQTYEYYSCTLNDYAEVKNTSVPVNFSINTKIPKGTFIYNGEEFISRGYNSLDNYRLSKIKINDDVRLENTRLTLSIPNDTQIHMLDAQQIKYFWHKGKIIPYTDEIALARARGHGFIMGISTPRFWLMALGIGMIAIAIGAKTREYFKKRQGVE